MEDIIEKTREAFKLSAAEIGTPRIELGFAAYKADVLPLNYVPIRTVHPKIASPEYPDLWFLRSVLGYGFTWLRCELFSVPYYFISKIVYVKFSFEQRLLTVVTCGWLDHDHVSCHLT